MREDLFANLPKLADLPPLEDTLAELSRLAFQEPLCYPSRWLEELALCGSSANLRIDSDGERSAMIGYPCDPDAEARKVRIDAIRSHYKQTTFTREDMLDYLETRGLVWDYRRRSASEVVKAARDFLAHGGRLMINHSGELETQMPLEQILSDDAPDPEGALSAAQQLSRVRCVGRHTMMLKRIVRSIGTRLDSGWIVLEPKRVRKTPARRMRLSPRYGR